MQADVLHLWACDAVVELHRQHARIQELEAQHREELRAYEITVANREARIAELDSRLEATQRNTHNTRNNT